MRPGQGQLRLVDSPKPRYRFGPALVLRWQIVGAIKSVACQRNYLPSKGSNRAGKKAVIFRQLQLKEQNREPIPDHTFRDIFCNCFGFACLTRSYQGRLSAIPDKLSVQLSVQPIGHVVWTRPERPSTRAREFCEETAGKANTTAAAITSAQVRIRCPPACFDGEQPLWA